MTEIEAKLKAKVKVRWKQSRLAIGKWNSNKREDRK